MTRTPRTKSSVQVERFHVHRPVTATGGGGGEGGGGGGGVIFIDLVGDGEEVDVVVSALVVPF